MNYKPFVSWGFYGGTSATERANYFASWGLMDALNPLVPTIGSLLARARGLWMHITRRRKQRGGLWA